MKVVIYKIFLNLNLILLSILSFSQVQDEYVLKKKSIHSEINYELIDCFIKFLECDNYKEKYNSIDEIFKPINGEFVIYNFIKTYKGLSYTGETKQFNDLLILKVDKNTQQIVDGYQYTKEWAELPPASDLYRITNKKIILENELNIKNLLFKNIYDEKLLEDISLIRFDKK